MPLLNYTVMPVNPFSGEGMVVAIVGLVLLVAAFYIVYKIVKDLIANAILGGIGLILLHFLLPQILPFKVPLSLLNIVIAIVAGVPGLIIVILLTILGISK
jgi:hypothetical protein